MAIFEAAGIAINTRLVAYVGPVKAPRATSAEFSVMCSGASLPLKLNFDTQREAETARRKLLGLIDAHDSHPR
nr:hypothetical protein [Dyella sp. ASV24]